MCLALTSPPVRELRSPALEFIYRCSDERPFGFRAQRGPGTRLYDAGNSDPVLNPVLSLTSGDGTYLREIRR